MDQIRRVAIVKWGRVATVPDRSRIGYDNNAIYDLTYIKVQFHDQAISEYTSSMAQPSVMLPMFQHSCPQLNYHSM
jgi:hypothetical protein